MACNSASSPDVFISPSTAGKNSGDVEASAWIPLPAARPVAAEVQALRDDILGVDATDPSTVKLWWYGVSSYVAAIGGHLVLLDAWESVGVHADTVPIGREELAALQPEAIFIGHGHFDHAADTGYIAGRSGAAVIAGQTVCDLARERAASSEGLMDFPCLILGGVQDPLPGVVQKVKVFADLPEIHVLQHIHSAADPMDVLSGEMPVVFVPDLVTYISNLNTDPEEIASALQSLSDDGGFGDPDGGTWAYHFRNGDFSLLWHDSAGPIADGNDYAAEIQTALDSFPGCVDVEAGAIVGFGMVSSGLRDSRLYVQHAHPQLFLPGHHDAWAPVIGPGSAALEEQWKAELENLENPPEMDYLRDPDDYMRVRSYHIDDPRWKVPMPGSSCANAP
ncbi:MAG: MBL fold metallo-hydrolase [Oceanococcus sp.]